MATRWLVWRPRAEVASWLAVSRDIERIAKSHESLGRHLDAAIDSGLTFRYAPERNPDWLV